MDSNEASSLIEQAATQALGVFEEVEKSDMLIEWVFVGCVTNTDEDGTYGYPILFSGGVMPPHRARGLLITGLRTLDGDEDPFT